MVVVGVSLGEVPSRTPQVAFRAAQRLDPHWDGVWSEGSDAVWSSIVQVRRQVAAGLRVRGVPAGVDLSGVAARARLERASPVWWERALDVLGAVQLYRTLSLQQLAWLTGVRQYAGAVLPTVLWDLFVLGLVDFGSTRSGLTGGELSGVARLIRPSKSRVFRSLLVPRMTYEEVVSVTGGGEFESHSQYDRHNVLASELLLRAAELTRVAAVAGERHAELGVLGYAGAGVVSPEVARMRRAADGVLVRSDGLRVAVEVTASTGRSFVAKVERWARVLSECRLWETGLVVVFVTAPRVGRSGSGQLGLQALVRKQVARVVRGLPGPVQDPTAARMLVVSWEDWFPGRGLVSSEFVRLVAARATLRDPLAPWERVSLLDVGVLSGLDVRLRECVGVLAGLRGQPRVLTDGVGVVELWRGVSGASGFGDVVANWRGVSAGPVGAVRFPGRLLPRPLR